MVDLLFEIGSSLLHKGCCDTAVVWLKRARELLEHQPLEGLSLDAGEMRMNLLHTSGQLCCARTATFPLTDAIFHKVRALYCSESAEARLEANEIIEILLLVFA